MSSINYEPEYQNEITLKYESIINNVDTTTEIPKKTVP